MIRASIRRPVAITMAYATVAALGAFSWRNLPLELLPDTQLPRLDVSGSWRGASPETVEAFLASPLESAVQRVRGVERIVSESFEDQGTGRAVVTVEFARGTDMDFARLELTERLSALEDELPPGVGPVQVQPWVPEAFQDQSRPFLSYMLTGPYTPEALRAHLDDVVRPALAGVEGVALVSVLGGRDRRLEIRLDPEASRSLGLGPAALQQRIQELDLVREAGVVREGGREWTVTIANRPSTPADILDAVIATAGTKPVRVRDVAAIRDTYEEATQHRRVDGRPAVTFAVLKEVGANTVAVADRVKAAVARLEPLLPYGSAYVLVDDESEVIRRQLSDLRARALAAALVIFLVLVAFLRSFASAATVFATLAFSVLVTLNLIHLGGISLNLLTLMGLAMGFGLLVDNAIVVLENVYARWQKGDAPQAAAERGTKDVVLPILASTATHLVVFVPFVYLQGELRVFYVPLAIVVVLSQLASLVVGFTFIPALSARLLGPGAAGRARSAPAAPLLHVRFHAAVLGWTLRHPRVAVGATAALFCASTWLFDRHVTRGVVWGGFGGADTYIEVRVTLPRGSDLERTDELVRSFEARIAAMPEVERYETAVTGTDGRIEVTFPDSLEDTAVPVAIKEQMVAYGHRFTGADVRVFGYGPSFYGGGSSPPHYTVAVLGYEYERVRDIAEELGARLTRMSRIEEVDTNASDRFTRDRAVEYVATIDREALARHDLTVQDLVSRVRAAVGGSSGIADLKLGGEEVAYQVKLEGSEEADVRALLGTRIQTPDGRPVRLGEVVSVAPREVMASIRRENQQYQRRVAYEFRGPVRLGNAVRDAVLARTAVPPGYAVEPAGDFRRRVEERGQIHGVLAVSLLLVYMVTAAVFESLRQPLVVLLTVPMGLIGTFLVFLCTGATFTREAYVGAIMAAGIVVSNAILLVDHVNRMRAVPGLGLDEAILRGTLERVRPILMTTATTVLGLLPLVLFSGADANVWNALGFTLIGGLVSSTALVITVTPAIYALVERGGDGTRPGGARSARPAPTRSGAA